MAGRWLTPWGSGRPETYKNEQRWNMETRFPFPERFPEPSRTFMDCDVFVAGTFLLPVSLPGTFPGLHGLRFFLNMCFRNRFYLPGSLPGTFPDLHGLQHFGKVWKSQRLWCYGAVKSDPIIKAAKLTFVG